MFRRVLLTGATGYVGGALLGELERIGHSVRCLARRPQALAETVGSGVEIVKGDVLDPASLAEAMRGMDAAYYLVHSMEGSHFEEKDRLGARNFGFAAEHAGVERIVYLGGLGGDGSDLSTHLRSRHEVGDMLREFRVPVIEFRASVILGAGSISFEMIRSLVDRLPIMITPKWVQTEAQPIGIADVIRYLVFALEVPLSGSRIYEIGGPSVVSYGDLMREYANQRGLRRLMVPVPFLTPGLSSLWLALVTPLYAKVGRRLIDSIRCPTVVHDTRALSEFPILPADVSTAMADALAGERAS